MSVGPPLPGTAATEGRRREVVSPEGVPLAFQLAEPGSRVLAFTLDLLLQLLLVAAILLATAISFAGQAWVAALGLVLFFLVRNFYFVFFETRWRGATPGKRRQGLRVIDAGGGPLTAEAVFVRNLTREVEVFWPLAVWWQLEQSGGSEGLLLALGSLWVFALALVPLFNRDRRRLGDLIAGTLVVRVPREVLLEDLSARSTRSPGSQSELEFTAAQLDVYGVYELQVLEELLRQRRDREAFLAVAERIQRKIGWSGPAVPARTFLQAFYRAQRAHLEQALLLGQARRRKR